MPRSLDARFFVDQVPEIELQDGFFRIAYDVGREARLEVVLAPSVYLKALRIANSAAAEFHEGKNAAVIPIRRSRRKSAEPAH